MTQDELAERVRDAVRDTFAGFATGEAKPYGMEINEANAALMHGAMLALVDAIIAASKPTPESRAFAAQWCADRIVSRVDALTNTVGSA